MKLLHLSDLHIGKKVNGFSMIEDQKHILREIVSIAEEQKPEGIIIAGDLYDKPIPSAEAVKLADSFITDLSALEIPLYIISGNHDSSERLSFGSRLMTRSGVYMAGVMDSTPEPIMVEDEYGPAAIYLLPFSKPIHVRSLYGDEEIVTYNDALARVVSELKPDTSIRNIMVSHQFISGALVSESEDISIGGLDQVGAEVFDDFDYVAMGHLHRPQWAGREEVRYCGTPLCYSFSEINQEKSVTVVELKEKGSVTIDTIPLHPLRNMREIAGPFDKIILPENYSAGNCDDYVRIVLTDEEEKIDTINRLRDVYPNVMKVEYKNSRTRLQQEISAGEDVAGKSPLELFSDFYQYQNNAEMSEEQRTIVSSIIESVWEE